MSHLEVEALARATGGGGARASATRARGLVDTMAGSTPNVAPAPPIIRPSLPKAEMGLPPGTEVSWPEGGRKRAGIVDRTLTVEGGDRVAKVVDEAVSGASCPCHSCTSTGPCQPPLYRMVEP